MYVYDRLFRGTVFALFCALIITAGLMMRAMWDEAIGMAKEGNAKRYNITVTNLATDKKTEYKNAELSKGWKRFTVTYEGQKTVYPYEGTSLFVEEVKQPEEKSEKIKE